MIWRSWICSGEEGCLKKDRPKAISDERACLGGSAAAGKAHSQAASGKRLPPLGWFLRGVAHAFISSGSTRAIARAPRPCRQPTRQTRTSARPTPATRKPPRVGAFGSGRAMLRRSCKTSRTATTPSMLLRHPSAKALQHAHSTLFRSRPRGRSPPRRPTCLLGAALWDRNESRRNLEAGETLLLCSGRPGFLRKVFALVSTQLLATVAICALFMCAAPEHARARTLARTHAYVATGRRATPCRTPPHTHL